MPYKLDQIQNMPVSRNRSWARTKLSAIALGVLIVCLPAASATAQHSIPQRPTPDLRKPGPNSWTSLLIDAISKGTGVEAWKTKEVMALRIKIDLETPQSEAESSADEASAPDAPVEGAETTGMSIHGRLHYDISRSKMRLDLDDGLTFLTTAESTIIWRRGDGAEALCREEVPNEALHTARALHYLITLPLWLDKKEGFYAPGGLRMVGDERFYSSVLLLRDPPPPQEPDAGEGEAENDADREQQPASQRQPDDWFAFYSRTHEPHRIEMAAYVVHEWSQPIDELPQPRMIFFDQFEDVEEVFIARKWRIHRFSRGEGLGEQIGRAQVKDVEFIERDASVFEPASGALELRKTAEHEAEAAM